MNYTPVPQNIFFTMNSTTFPKIIWHFSKTQIFTVDSTAIFKNISFYSAFYSFVQFCIPSGLNSPSLALPSEQPPLQKYKFLPWILQLCSKTHAFTMNLSTCCKMPPFVSKTSVFTMNYTPVLKNICFYNEFYNFSRNYSAVFKNANFYNEFCSSFQKHMFLRCILQLFSILHHLRA